MNSLWLNDHRRNVFSQNGEDGILDALFSRIGHGQRWCVEFGAWDGIFLSNTRNLIENYGWSSVQIEADPTKFRLERNCTPFYRRVTPIRALVQPSGVDSLDCILEESEIPRNFDLLSIDVDGADHDIWVGLKNYRPRVVVIEVNSQFFPRGWDTERDGKGYKGCQAGEGYTSISLMVDTAKAKGYELAFHTGNCIFVLREYCDVLDIDTENWADLFDANAGEQGPPQFRRSHE